MSAKVSFAKFNGSATISDVGQCIFPLNAWRLERASGLPEMLLLVIAGMTDEK